MAPVDKAQPDFAHEQPRQGAAAGAGNRRPSLQRLAPAGSRSIASQTRSNRCPLASVYGAAAHRGHEFRREKVRDVADSPVFVVIERCSGQFQHQRPQQRRHQNDFAFRATVPATAGVDIDARIATGPDMRIACSVPAGIHSARLAARPRCRAPPSPSSRPTPPKLSCARRWLCGSIKEPPAKSLAMPASGARRCLIIVAVGAFHTVSDFRRSLAGRLRSDATYAALAASRSEAWRRDPLSSALSMSAM